MLAILLTVVCLANILLASIIFIRNSHNAINLSFSSVIFSLVCWMVVNYFSNQTTDYSNAFLFNKFIFLISPFISYYLLYFSIVFPKPLIQITLKKTIILCIPLVISVILTLDNLTMKGITFTSGATGVVFGPGIYYFTTQFLAYVLIAIFLLVKKLKNASGADKVQIQYLLFGFSLMTIGGVFLNLLLPLVFNIFWLSNYGPFSSLFLIFFTSYSILKHRLMDIRFIIARSIAYSLLVILFALFYTFSLLGINSLIYHTNVAADHMWPQVIIVLFISFTFQPLKQLLEKVTDMVFYKDKYDFNKVIYNLTHIMASTLSLEDICHKILKDVLDEMHINHGAFILMDEDKIFQIFHEGYNKSPEYDEHDINLLVKNRLLILDETQDDTIKSILRKLDLSLTIKLQTEKKQIGLLIFGDKLSGDIYSQNDINLIEILAPEAAVAIENAKSYEEISNFNITLQKEVDRSTKELQLTADSLYKKNIEIAEVSKNLEAANSKLQALDKLKDEFVSLASHELRTPMTAIKSYLWLYLQNKNVSTQENGKQTTYIERAYEATDRLITLVNDMLNVSRIESGRLDIIPNKIDMKQLIKDVIEELSPTAMKQQVNLSMDANLDTEFPKVIADQNKIREVLINLIGNSLKFTLPGGSITIHIYQDKNEIITQVKDTGKGIKAEDLPKLFQKFAIVGNNYLQKQNAQGTGLGLYISKSIINLHGGKIWVESEGEGKGTTFSFSLKVAESSTDSTIAPIHAMQTSEAPAAPLQVAQ